MQEIDERMEVLKRELERINKDADDTQVALGLLVVLGVVITPVVRLTTSRLSICLMCCGQRCVLFSMRPSNWTSK
jgi:hypothetical protein